MNNTRSDEMIKVGYFWFNYDKTLSLFVTFNDSKINWLNNAKIVKNTRLRL